MKAAEPEAHYRVNPSQPLRRLFRAKGSRFNGRPPVSKTGCGGSNPSSPARPTGKWDAEKMALHAERLKAMSGEAPESRAGALWERIKQHPKRWGEFLHEVRVELRQVTWPTRHEVVG